MIVLAWAVFVLSAIFGTIGLMRSFTGPEPQPLPSLSAPFPSGRDATVALDPDDRPAMYAWAQERISFQCTVKDGDGRSYALTRAKGPVQIPIGEQRWELVFDIGVTKAGDYTAHCRAPEGYRAWFRIGSDHSESAGERAGEAAGNVLASFAVPVAGFLFALIVTVVVVKRRAAPPPPVRPSAGERH